MSDYPANKLIPGTVYQVIQLLGQGGMGTVYEVEDTSVGKRYVLKTLHAQLRDRQELAARLHKEARTLARLSHPNIVEVVTAGLTADSLKLPYFVMQKLNGHTLRSVIGAKGRLPLETAYSIAIDLLDALDHAHAAGVIHRDVKPENIFLHRGPNDAHQTKLLDFGVMRMLSGDEPHTGSRFVGTLRYAPPEQLRAGKITPRTDLYAAGLVLYEMVAGSGPFDEETTDRGIANAHLHKTPPPLARRVEVPADLEKLVASALAKDPDARPRDAFAFASRLRVLAREAADARSRSSRPGPVDALLGTMGAPPSPTNLDESATTTGATESPQTPRLPRRRTAAFALAAGALAAAATLAIVGARWAAKRSHPAEAPSNAAATSTSTSTSTPREASTSPPAALPSAAPSAPPPPALPPTHAPPRPSHRTPVAPSPPASASAAARPRLPGPGF